MQLDASIIIPVITNIVAGTYIGKLSGLVLKDYKKDDDCKNNILKVILSLTLIVILYQLYVTLAKMFHINLTSETNIIMAWTVFNANIHISQIFQNLIRDIPPTL